MLGINVLGTEKSPLKKVVYYKLLKNYNNACSVGDVGNIEHWSKIIGLPEDIINIWLQDPFWFSKETSYPEGLFDEELKEAEELYAPITIEFQAEALYQVINNESVFENLSSRQCVLVVKKLNKRGYYIRKPS